MLGVSELFITVICYKQLFLWLPAMLNLPGEWWSRNRKFNKFNKLSENS